MNPNLTRTFTAPMPSHPKLHSSANYGTGSHYSLNSQPSIRSSASTQNTSNSTLASASASATNAGAAPRPIAASDNVMNRVAHQNTSLFQMCVALRARLSGVPGFEEQVLQVKEEHPENLDPVLLLWHTFRREDTLLMIYNALSPQEPLYVDKKVLPPKRAEVAAYKFLQACINKLKFPMEECYMITDLKTTNDNKDINMGGFAKVVRVVTRVVDILVRQGVLVDGSGHDAPPPGNGTMPKRTHRQHVVDEMVRTERTYVQHLELLQLFSQHVKQSNSISPDAIMDIFLNLDVLLEFQRRFLVRVEQTNAQNEADQNWGRLFYAYAQPSSNPEKDFRVYEPYIENQKRCEEAAMREFDKLKSVGGSMELRQMVESPTHFTSFLLKPFQRLSKYPLLLKELREKGDLPDDRKSDLTQGIETITAILNTTNASIDREEKIEAVHALKSQVEDWKSHRVEAFGDLLLYGTYTVLKGDPAKQEEREYRMYLFEKILLCCKEINPNKPKNKIRGTSAAPDKKGRPRLQLKGRIFMQNVTKTVINSKQGSYTCGIYWRGDENIESFAIRFNTEDLLKKWRDKIEAQREVCSDKTNFNASETEFTYLRDKPSLENPYRDDDIAEDDLDNPSLAYIDSSDLPMSRNGSSTSLRSRSTTNESLQQPRSRPPMGASGLSVRTQPPSVSPMERNGPSYFSPSVDSPATMSSRTSTSSNLLPYQRQVQPQNGYYREDQSGYPTMYRGSQGNIYQAEGRTGSSSSYASSYQSRYRSASNPDMQNASKQRGPTTHPPVPSIPPHVQQNAQNINRSPNGSPFSPRRALPSAEQVPYSHPSYHYGAENTAYDGYDASGGQEHGQQRFYQQGGNTMSPPLDSAASTNEPMTPSQLKVKVRVPSEGSNLTLIVGFNISYQSLRDRIDAKLQRNTNVSLATGSVQLKYLYDDEYVKIQNDEDVQTAFETWREQQQDDFVGPLGEIELYCLMAG